MSGNFGTGVIGRVFQEALSEDDVFFSNFCVEFGAVAGKLGLPIQSKFFWKALIGDLCESSFCGFKESRISFKESEPDLRRGTGKTIKARLKIETSNNNAPYMIHFDLNEDLRSLKEGFLGGLKRLGSPLLEDFLRSSGHNSSFCDRWSNLMSKMFSLHLKKKSARLVGNIFLLEIETLLEVIEKLLFVDKKATDSETESFKIFQGKYKELEEEELLEFVINDARAFNKLSDSVQQLGLSRSSLQKVDENLFRLRQRQQQIVQLVESIRFVAHVTVDEPKTMRTRFENRISEWSEIGSFFFFLDGVERIYQQYFPLWTGYSRYPEQQKRWRAKTSTSELKKTEKFKYIRLLVRLCRKYDCNFPDLEKEINFGTLFSVDEVVDLVPKTPARKRGRLPKKQIDGDVVEEKAKEEWKPVGGALSWADDLIFRCEKALATDTVTPPSEFDVRREDLLSSWNDEKEGKLTWVDVLRLCQNNKSNNVAVIKQIQRREHIFAKFFQVVIKILVLVIILIFVIIFFIRFKDMQ